MILGDTKKPSFKVSKNDNNNTPVEASFKVKKNDNYNTPVEAWEFLLNNMQQEARNKIIWSPFYVSPGIYRPCRRYTVYSDCLPVHGGRYSDNTNLFESSAYSTARVVAKSPTGNVATDQKDPNLESQTGRASTAHIFVNPSRPAAVCGLRVPRRQPLYQPRRP